MNSSMCIKESSYNDFEYNIMACMLNEILKLTYYDTGNKVMLFRCNWYDTERDIRVHHNYGLMDAP